MQTISDAFRLAKNTDHTVVFLIALAGVHRYFVSYPLRHSGGWRVGEGLILGSGWLLGGAHEDYNRQLARLDDGGIGSIEHELNARDGSARISGVTMALRNEQNYAAFTASRVLDNTAVTVRVGFAGLGYSEYLPIWSGVVDSYSVTRDALNIDAIDATFKTHKNLSTPLGGEYFSGVPTASQGRAIPIILGRNIEVEALLLTGNAVGSLAFDVSLIAVHADLVEFGAAFPPSGTVTIGTETGITYSERDQTVLSRKTYLRLQGLTRGSPITHVAGEAVTLTNVVFTYLIGYQVFDLSAVRIDGVLQTTGYTFFQAVTGADRPVSLLTFATEPAGVVTVDVRGGNLVLQPLFVNGDFETGDATGWTAGAGTITVTTGTTDEGTYKAEVLGAFLTFGDVYQDFPTQSGTRYTIELAYRDQEEGTNLIPNGDFETGVLAPAVDESAGGALVQAAGPGAIGANSGLYAVAIGAAVPGVDTNYQGSLYWDIATTIATDYVFSCWYTSEQFFATGGVSTAWNSLAGYALGTPANPIEIDDVTFPQQQVGYVSTSTGFRKLYYDSGPIPFVATDTTTRITLRGQGQSSSYNPPATYFDDVKVIEAGLVERSRSGVQLGTPLDPVLYADTALPRRLGYVVHEVSFVAETAVSRLTLQSQYDGLPIASFFDHVRVRDSGLSAVEAIRYILRTFLPGLEVNEAAFARAALARDSWLFGTLLRDPGDSRALLQRMAAQCACWYLEDGQGRATLVPIPLPLQGEPQVADYTFTAGQIEEDSVTVTREPLDNVYTEFYVYYGYNGRGDLDDGASYSGVVYATPTRASLRQQGWEQHCRGALLTYGRVQRLTTYADFIQDFETAILLLEHQVKTRTVRQSDITLRTWLGAVHLELGDVVMVDSPLLYTDQPLLAAVMKWTVLPPRAVVEIRARTFATTEQLG